MPRRPGFEPADEDEAPLPCPECGSTAGFDLIRAAMLDARCRSCRNRIAIAESIDAFHTWIDDEAEIEDWDVRLDDPPRGVSVERDFGFGVGTRVSVRRINALAWFLLAFTVFWGGMSVGGIYGSQITSGKFSLMQSLFGLPFLLGTIVLLGALAFLFLGRRVITLDDGVGRVWLGVGPVGRVKEFEYDRTTRVAIGPGSARSNGRPIDEVHVDARDGRLSFGALWRGEQKRYVAALLIRAMRDGT